jgi:ankyrin repeat protein
MHIDTFITSLETNDFELFKSLIEENEFDFDKLYVLEFIVMLNNIEFLKYLVDEKYVFLSENSESNKHLLLRFATRHNNLDMVKYLHSLNADMHYKNHDYNNDVSSFEISENLEDLTILKYFKLIENLKSLNYET